MTGKDTYEFTDQFKISDEIRFFDDGNQGLDLSNIIL